MEYQEWHDKVDTYFGMLHPNFDSMSIDEQNKALEDKFFIIENTEAVHDQYTRFTSLGANLSDVQKMQQVLKHVKVEKYFDLLHPDFDSLPPAEKWNVIDDKNFIIDHLDEIHTAFSEFGNSDSKEYMYKATDKEKIEKAFKQAKEKEEGTKSLSVSEVAQNALKQGITTSQVKEANIIEQQEQKENTKDGETRND